MKHFFYFSLFLSSLCFVATGCTVDPCKDKNCHSGACTDGTCKCNEGYQGTDCSVETRGSLVGSWTGTETISGNTTIITATIVRGSSPKQLILNNILTCSGGNLALTTAISNVGVIDGLTSASCTGNTLTYSNVNGILTGNHLVLSFNLKANSVSVPIYCDFTRN
ncbi:MAG: Tenascin domain [Bacteroidota bacterium]|jgi:hypothetical protein